MASGWFNRAKKEIFDGTIDLLADTIKVMLVNNTYTFNPDDDFIGSGGGTVGGAELSGTGYTGGFNGAGRKTLGTKSITEDDTNNRAVFAAANSQWSAINAGTIAACVLVKEGTTDADSKLIAYIDNAAQFPLVTNGGDVTIAWNAAGILQIT